MILRESRTGGSARPGRARRKERAVSVDLATSSLCSWCELLPATWREYRTIIPKTETLFWRRYKIGSLLHKHTDLCLVLDKICIYHSNIFTSNKLHQRMKLTIVYRNFARYSFYGILIMEQ